MIKGSWQNIRLVCGNHGNDYSHEMIIHQGREGMSTFYSCPCYRNILNKEINGRSCNNRLNIIDYQNMLDTIMNERYDDNGNETSLLGYKWSKKGIDYSIINEDKKITVVMLNKKAIGR